MIHSARRIRRTVYTVAGLYVFIGFLVAVPAALSGERLQTFLGFLIISGALGAALTLSILLRAAAQLSLMSEQLTQLRGRLDAVQQAAESTRYAPAKPTIYSFDETQSVYRSLLPDQGQVQNREPDISLMGRGDPSPLIAATLDESTFPRLVRTEQLDVPAAAEEPNDLPRVNPETPLPYQGRGQGEGSGLASSQQMLRALPSSGADAAEIDLEIGSNADDTAPKARSRLRAAFADCIRRKDWRGALEVGHEIRALLPDSSYAREFADLEPLLRRRAAKVG